MNIVFKLNEIANAAQLLMSNINTLSTAGNRETVVCAFHGEMGAGKTTFIKEICKVLGVANEVCSPTFSIINEYSAKNGITINHIDLYRLKNEQEAINAGVEECFYSGNYCFIEWPEIAPNIIPENAVHCYLNIEGNNERKLQINL